MRDILGRICSGSAAGKLSVLVTLVPVWSSSPQEPVASLESPTRRWLALPRPIGLGLGARTPEGTAAFIAAEFIAVAAAELGFAPRDPRVRNPPLPPSGQPVPGGRFWTMVRS